MNSTPNEREAQKNKLIGRAEVGGTCDFVDMITADPFLLAYKSKQSDSKHSSRNLSNSNRP